MGTSAALGNNPGTLYELTLSGTFTVLWSFGKSSADGSFTPGGLVQGADGSLYGLSEQGGTDHRGTVFKFN
jgi:uncharacterized repeat protein (TIGR03803 family)